jgi:hypothetical protein
MTVVRTPGGRSHVEVEPGSAAEYMEVPDGFGGTMRLPTDAEKRALFLEASLAEVQRLQASGKYTKYEDIMRLKVSRKILSDYSADAIRSLRQERRREQVRDTMPQVMTAIGSVVPLELMPEGSPEREAFLEPYEKALSAALEHATRSEEMIDEREIGSITSRLAQAAQNQLSTNAEYVALKARLQGAAAAEKKAGGVVAGAEATVENEALLTDATEAQARIGVAGEAETARARVQPGVRGPLDEQARDDAIRGAMPGQEDRRARRADAVPDAQAKAEAEVAGQSVMDRLRPPPTAAEAKAQAALKGTLTGIEKQAESDITGEELTTEEKEAAKIRGQMKGAGEAGGDPDETFANDARQIRRKYTNPDGTMSGDPKQRNAELKALWKRVYGTDEDPTDQQVYELMLRLGV